MHLQSQNIGRGCNVERKQTQARSQSSDGHPAWAEEYSRRRICFLALYANEREVDDGEDEESEARREVGEASNGHQQSEHQDDTDPDQRSRYRCPGGGV